MINKIRAEIKEAMKEKNVAIKNVLKSALDKATLEAKEKKVEISDEIVINAINKEIKQLNQTIESVKERPESDIYVESMKQKELSKEEIEEEILKIVEIQNTTDRGPLMKAIMSSLKGKADEKTINEIATKVLKEKLN